MVLHLLATSNDLSAYSQTHHQESLNDYDPTDTRSLWAIPINDVRRIINGPLRSATTSIENRAMRIISRQHVQPRSFGTTPFSKKCLVESIPGPYLFYVIYLNHIGIMITGENGIIAKSGWLLSYCSCVLACSLPVCVCLRIECD